MSNTITIRVTVLDDDLLLDSQALALMFGVTIEEVRALSPDGYGFANAAGIPAEWMRQGRRRARRSQSAHRLNGDARRPSVLGTAGPRRRD